MVVVESAIPQGHGHAVLYAAVLVLADHGAVAVEVGAGVDVGLVVDGEGGLALLPAPSDAGTFSREKMRVASPKSKVGT